MEKTQAVNKHAAPAESVQWTVISKYISRILLILLAFVPLVLDNGVIFPYISGKMLMIRFFITLVLLLIAIALIASKRFREELYSKVYKLFHNPVFLATGLFIFFVATSVIVAVDKYRAFFGNVERAEGFVGILFYFLFFPLAYIVFDRKSWIWFFKATLVTGLVLFINEMMSIPADSNAARPGSFTGNPSFLAGVFLFVIMAALIVFYNSRKESRIPRLSWQIGSSLMILFSVIGIFETQTRGTILGLAAGLVVLAIYWLVKGKGVKLYKQLDLRLAAVILIALLVVFSGFFFETRNDSFWQKIPGMSRFAQLTLDHITQDPTVQTRLISTEIGLKAMNPNTVGVTRFLFGWGQENFDIAYNTFYNPVYYQYEQEWFDRAHDKVMDALVMNGALGLLAYLSMWGTFIWVGFKKKGFSFEAMAVLFFGVAFFVNLLSLFDQISTYIPLFAALGFMAYIRDEEHHGEIKPSSSSIVPYLLYTFVGVLLVFCSYIFVLSTITYSQMRSYVGLLETENLQTIEQGLPSVLTPYTYGQQDIRGDLVQEIAGQYEEYATDQSMAQYMPDVLSFLNESIADEEQVVQLDPNDPRQMLIVAEGYDSEGRVAVETANSAQPTPAAIADFQEAQKYYQMAYALAPKRQDVLLPLAQNLVYQGEINQAIPYLVQCYTEDPQIALANYELGLVLTFTGNQSYAKAVPLLNFALNYYATDLSQLGGTDQLIQTYQSMLAYFYQQRDSKNFVLALNGLAILQPSNSNEINVGIADAQAGRWSAINTNSL